MNRPKTPVRGGNRKKMAHKPRPYIKKTELSREDLPHFQWELRPVRSMAEQFFKDHPMSGARNKAIEKARQAAIDVILANMRNGMDLIVPNFAEASIETHGFGRRVFLDVLEYLQAPTLIGREGEGYKRSIITYSTRMRCYLPTKVVFQPLTPIRINLKDEEITVTQINKLTRGDLKRRLRKMWGFYQEHDISPGIDRDTFELFNDVEVEVEGKPPLIFPDSAKILPQIVFNDRDLTMGGRMYGAFWIGMKSILRREITIDGELTSDIDGKGMHVQLLYRDRGIPMPKGDPYMFSDPAKREIAKKLMVLMMNTKSVLDPVAGRKAVERTFRNHYGHEDGLDDLILELEGHHYAIVDDLYRPNWSNLQRTEAAIMLRIMERGMEENIVVLPVHDGCLCPRQYVDRVCQYFIGEDIVAEVSQKHYRELPVDKYQKALAAVRDMRQAA